MGLFLAHHLTGAIAEQVQSQKSAFWNPAAVYPSANKTTTATALIPEPPS